MVSCARRFARSGSFLVVIRFTNASKDFVI